MQKKQILGFRPIFANSRYIPYIAKSAALVDPCAPKPKNLLHALNGALVESLDKDWQISRGHITLYIAGLWIQAIYRAADFAI